MKKTITDSQNKSVFLKNSDEHKTPKGFTKSKYDNVQNVQNNDKRFSNVQKTIVNNNFKL